MRRIEDLSRDELLTLLTDFAKRWLAHDGLWFQAVEARHGIEAAMESDTEAMERLMLLEAGRIKKFLNLPEAGGLQALAEALQFRMYALVNEQSIAWTDDGKTLIFRMNRCRVQEARERKQMTPFPCKSVGLAEYTTFARAIDPRILTSVLTCPPDSHPDDYFCAWAFSLTA